MRRRFFLFGFSFLFVVNVICSFNVKAAAFADGKTLVLYDAAAGVTPDSSMIGFTAFPPDGASVRYEDGSTLFDTTTADTDTYAGWAASPATTDGFPALDANAGFRINFTVQIEDESHESNNRSGFSIILLDQEARGIEMSFWRNEIWVQNDDTTGGLFTHGEGAAFDTTAALIEYQVTIAGSTYTLTANSQPLLTGTVRDYSAFDRFPDPYETPNFLFLGDDTTSAQARIRLHFLSVTGTEPMLPTSPVTSTSLPQPTVTSPAFPIATPFPTPAPASPAIELCPSGWLLLVVMLSCVPVIGTNRRKLPNY